MISLKPLLLLLLTFSDVCTSVGRATTYKTDLSKAVRAMVGARPSSWVAFLRTASVARGLDPFFVAALVHRESRWKRSLVSRRNYGLMQVRVSSTTNSRYIGKEAKLFDAKRNITLGIRMLAYWRSYHLRTCKQGRHFWWAHYQWGSRVGNNASATRVMKTYIRYLTVGSTVRDKLGKFTVHAPKAKKHVW